MKVLVTLLLALAIGHTTPFVSAADKPSVPVPVHQSTVHKRAAPTPPVINPNPGYNVTMHGTLFGTEHKALLSVSGADNLASLHVDGNSGSIYNFSDPKAGCKSWTPEDSCQACGNPTGSVSSFQLVPPTSKYNGTTILNGALHDVFIYDSKAPHVVAPSVRTVHKKTVSSAPSPPPMPTPTSAPVHRPHFTLVFLVQQATDTLTNIQVIASEASITLTLGTIAYGAQPLSDYTPPTACPPPSCPPGQPCSACQCILPFGESTPTAEAMPYTIGDIVLDVMENF
eukprot:TRINITY_DN28870_c0_g1_i1.p1 TRINITY_DN28870_c0_g1~~TRINITY_DN28870_c0_g1_i1.p1  ORF type:complete len:284 (+),score=47.22 TRINITY_DN28870_c0_g1_i1:325-1176(+)